MVVDRVLLNVCFVSEFVPAFFLLFSSSFSSFRTSFEIGCPSVPQETANGRLVVYLFSQVYMAIDVPEIRNGKMRAFDLPVNAGSCRLTR